MTFYFNTETVILLEKKLLAVLLINSVLHYVCFVITKLLSG